MLKVCKSNNNDLKILSLLYENREGLRVKTITKLSNLKARCVYKRLTILKSKGLVQNDYPLWRISHGQSKFVQSLLGSSNLFELHNMSYVVKLLKVPSWWSKRKNYLIKLKDWDFKVVDFGNSSSSPYYQLKNDSFVIQCYPESLIIISRKRYYSDNPYETVKSAMFDVISLLDWFCERFRFNFFVDGVPHIQVRNNDFNRMNDALANHVRRDGSKFLVELDSRRKVWVDMSEPFGKEANYPEGQERLEVVTRDLLTKSSLLPSEITSMIGQVTQNQLMFAQNIDTHMKVLRDIGSAIVELREEVKRLSHG